MQADVKLRYYNDYLHIVSIALFGRVSQYNSVLKSSVEHRATETKS